MPDKDENQYDLLVNAEVNHPHMNKQMKAVVVGRHRDDNGSLVGTRDDNTIMSTVCNTYFGIFIIFFFSFEKKLVKNILVPVKYQIFPKMRKKFRSRIL